MRGPARRAEALYILGDLFETWIGDDAIGEFEHRIAGTLRDAADSGLSIHFMTGNRDFLLGESYCRLAGMALLEEPTSINLYGTPTLLLHGDVLCTDDVAYQRFRKRVHDPAWQERMLRRPVWVRRLVARAMRAASRARTRRAAQEIMDVAEKSVIEAFERAGTLRMIHGHTHRPGDHIHSTPAGPARRIVLGDWFDQQSMLRSDPGQTRLEPSPQGDQPQFSG